MNEGREGCKDMVNLKRYAELDQAQKWSGGGEGLPQYPTTSGTTFAAFESPNDLSEACLTSRCFRSSFPSVLIECCCRDAAMPTTPSDSSLLVTTAALWVFERPSSILVKLAGAISMVLKFGSTVSSRMNGSPTPRARNMAGMMTDMLHTVIDTAASTPPEQNKCMVSSSPGVRVI